MSKDDSSRAVVSESGHPAVRVGEEGLLPVLVELFEFCVNSVHCFH